MATKKKNSTKGLSQKVRKMVMGDIVKSIAIASVLLNVLFLVSVLVLTSTNVFDRDVYGAARERYCTNPHAFEKRADELGDSASALKERQVDCIGDGFRPFYNEALEKYEATVKADQ